MIKQIIQSVFLVLLGLIVSLGLIEILFRIAYRAPAKWNDRPFAYYKAEDSPTSQSYPYLKTKPENIFRIAVVGDSYTFAPYMQFTDAFPARLEQMLNLNKDVRQVEVINYGVPAYSTSHEVATVERALKEDADFVLLQITLNDPEIKPYRPVGITEFNRFGALQLGPRLGWLVSYWRSLGYVLNRLHNSKTHREYKQYFFELFENPKGFKKFKDSLVKIYKLCSDRKVGMGAVVFPLFGEPVDDNYPFTPLHKIVGETLGELGVVTLDLLPTYTGVPIDRLQVIPGGDRHPNEIAHRMAAESIYRWLISNKLIPEEFKIRNLYSDRTRIVNEPLYEGEY